MYVKKFVFNEKLLKVFDLYVQIWVLERLQW